MIAVAIAILSTLVAGIPIVLLLRPSARAAEALALAYLSGTGLVFSSMLLLSICQIPWSLPSVAATVLIASGATLLVAKRRARPATVVPPRASAEPRADEPWADEPRAARLLALGCDAATAVLFCGYALYTTLAPLWEWDYWAIWGLKAHVFFEHGGIDWAWLETPYNSFSHPDYPLLLPLNFDFAALVAGGWSDRWLGLLNVAFALALVIVVRTSLRRTMSSLVAAIGTFLVASLACTRFVGLAEGALIALSSAGCILLYEALRAGEASAESRELTRFAALLLGLAASTKNEGLALLAACALAYALASLPHLVRAWRLWPAALIAAPWLVLRAIHVLPTDLATGSMSSRFAAHLRELPRIGHALWDNLADPMFWAVLLISWIVIAGLRATGAKSEDIQTRRATEFLYLAMAIQLGFYLLTYLITPSDVVWHISTSWTRLTAQLAIPLTFATIVLLARIVAERPRPIEVTE